MNRYRILSFDGGGIRGALSVTILKRLYERFPEMIRRCNLLAGTSTGSLIALGLARGLKPEEILELYSRENARFVFAPRCWGLLGPKYSNKNLRVLLEKVFPENLRLRDLRKKVVVTSFQLKDCVDKNWCPVFFNNLPGSDYMDIPVIDAALASCAVPGFFPSFKDCIDGGVVANNPSAVAISFALKERVRKISLLSLGTGYRPQRIIVNTKRWGVLEWLTELFPVMTDGANRADTMVSSNILGNNFYRINPLLNEDISLDDHRKIPDLIKQGQNLELENAKRWIKYKWY